MPVGRDLVGRDEEIAVLGRFLDGAGAAALVLRGEAGVGKTALANELAEHATGWRIVRAVGVDAESSFTLGGLNQVAYGLREHADSLSVDDRSVLAPVFGADPPAAPQPLPLAMAVLNLLGAAAVSTPLLVIVDDVHWFDELSATVLSVAGRRLRDPRVRLLVTYRPNTGAEFASAGWAEHALGPLDTAAAAELVNRASNGMSSSARQAILDIADGNPLALRELPRCADQIAEWGSAVPLTDRLVTVFGGRLLQLAADVRAQLLRAALDGSGAGARYAMVDVQPAVDADLVVVNPLGEMSFRHPLVRAAVIHQASPDERRAAHGFLATLYDDVLVRRATHRSAAVSAPDQEVADLLADAARLTIRRGGAAIAVDWLRRAAQLSTVAARRTELLADAAFVASQAARYDDAREFVAPDDAIEDSATAVLTAAYVAMYRDGEVVGTLRRVLGTLRRSRDDAVLPRLVNLALALAQYAADAALWRQTEDVLDELVVGELSQLYRDAWGDTARRGVSVRARLEQRYDDAASGEPWELMRLGVAAYYVDGLADLRDALQRMFDREHTRGAVTNAITAQHLLLLDQLNSGQWDRAAETGRIGLQLTTIHRNDLFGYQFTAYLAVLAAARGDADEARQRVTEVIGWAGPRRIGMLLGWAQRATVLIGLAGGDYEVAYGAACRIAEAGILPPYSHTAIDSVLDFVQAAVHSGHTADARRHAEAAASLAEVSPRLAAVVAAVLAMTGPDDEADAGYGGALDHPGLHGFPFDAARIRLEYGMWLRRQRRHTQARTQLAMATDVFDALGAGPWADRARTELRAAGATVKRSDGTVLSAQERRIAELAAAGHSNKQIAAALYLSPRTVGAHLYRIFPKLGVTSRAGLGAALRDGEG